MRANRDSEKQLSELELEVIVYSCGHDWLGVIFCSLSLIPVSLQQMQCELSLQYNGVHGTEMHQNTISIGSAK